MSKEIDATIERWFVETAEHINTKVETDTNVDNLCSSVVPLAHNYCTAVLLLLDNGRKLPAMALLRVLAELAFRCIWCLYQDNPENETPNVRVERWLKKSYHERISLLERMIRSSTVPKSDKGTFRKETKQLRELMEEIPHREAAPLFNSVEELPPAYREDIYPCLYSTFNRAVHPDILLLGDMVREKGQTRVFLSDLEHIKIDPLKIYCMTVVFNILSVFRLYYKWDYTTIKSEYLQIKRRFKEK